MGEIPTLMVESDEGGSANRSERSANVVLDMESLAHFTDNNNKEFISSPRITLQRSLSRKGSYRCEKKISEKESDETSKQAPSKGLGLNSTPEKCVILPMEVESSSSRCKRYNNNNNNKISPTWVDPRRILLIFATLSSMGTIILIYFTLALGKINGDDIQAH